jgi:hypothetical protein
MKAEEVKPAPGVDLLEVVLQNLITNLEEVVATGYFSRKKEDFTGSAVVYREKTSKRSAPLTFFKVLKLSIHPLKYRKTICWDQTPTGCPISM